MMFSRRDMLLSVFALPLLALHDARSRMPKPTGGASLLLVRHPHEWVHYDGTMRSLRVAISEQWDRAIIVPGDVRDVEYEIWSTAAPHMPINIRRII